MGQNDGDQRTPTGRGSEQPHAGSGRSAVAMESNRCRAGTVSGGGWLGARGSGDQGSGVVVWRYGRGFGRSRVTAYILRMNESSAGAWVRGRTLRVAAVCAATFTSVGCHHASAPTGVGSPRGVAACVAPASAAPTASLAATPVTNPAATFDTAWSIIARSYWDTTYNGVDWKGVRDELRPRAAAARNTGSFAGC